VGVLEAVAAGGDDRGSPVVTRRLLLVLSVPLWGPVVLLFILVSVGRSAGGWLRTGDWRLPDQLPPFWTDRWETWLDGWTRRMAQ